MNDAESWEYLEDAGRLVWVPHVADPTAPRAQEIEAGVELGPNLDPRWDWIECPEFDGTTRYVRGRCRHREVVPVQSVDGETVAHLCRTCDTQLPAG